MYNTIHRSCESKYFNILVDWNRRLSFPYLWNTMKKMCQKKIIWKYSNMNKCCFNQLYIGINYCSVTQLCLTLTPWTAARQASLSFTISWNLLKLMSIESVMPSNHFVLCYPLLLLPSSFPRISLSQYVSTLHHVAKVLELQLQHQSF